MSLPDRLGSGDHPASRDVDPPDLSGTGLMQKCIIIQRDEKGYGFTVSGDNPVFVASVKQDGAAAKAGVQTGDRIIKVNGALVTQRNHLDVVRLIKSGYYVALTLLGKPTPTTTTSSGLVTQTSFSSNRDSFLERVTAPQPVDPGKDRELWQQKVHMTRAMYETAKEDFEKLQKLYVSKPSEKLHSQLLDKEKTVKALDNQLKQLTGGQDTSMPSSTITIPIHFVDSENVAVESSTFQSWAPTLPTANTSDLGSMSDSPQTSPSVSPTPNDPSSRLNGQDMEDIIHIDDEEINSDDDQATDPGPFAEIRLLENRPAHLAVLLNYLISNSDPSPVLFHIICDIYQRSAGSIKELRKWAYEIFSTFIYKMAPLSIEVEESIISQIDNILASSGSRTDNENVLRGMFQAPRQCVQMEIAELLTDFRMKKDLGMGNLFGIQKVHDNMERSLEVRVAEDLLVPHLKYFGAENNSRSVVVDKDLATGWALATFLRSLGGPKTANSAIIERVQTFMMKDKKSIKFPGSRSSRAKAMKGHQFTLQHFYVTTFCSFCGNLVWGVGYQGYQCQSCDMTLHKSCAEEITEQCAGKQKKRISTKLLPPLQTRRSSSLTPGNQQQPHPVTDLAAYTITAHPDPVTPVTVQPYPRQEESELGATLSIIAGLPTEHSVKSIIKRYQVLTSPTLATSEQPGCVVNNNTKTDRRGSTDLNRSGSLNSKEEKGERPKRSNSDVTVNADTFKSMDQSASSSASSLSNRSLESPGTSTDNVSDLLRAHNEDPDLDVEPELPTLKHVLPEEVLRKLKPKEKKRQEVINELFYTERAHLRNLKVLDLLFHRPMYQEKGIMVELARALFPNMEEMISLHVTFVKDIKERSQTSAVVKDVGDLLLKRFDGDAGERFRKGCAEYCRNQAFALDALKKQTRKEPKLQQFLHDAESNSLCRRLQLKDLVPSQMQRLTKYPLLIDSLLKYTHAQSEEYKKLERALERCKHILAYVNQAVKECENYHKLKEIQKKLDRRSVEGLNDPVLTELKSLDLTQHKLIFDGPLTWKLRNHRTLDMHVLLFDHMLVLLQKQDDKYVLKCQNTNAQPARDDKYTHYPILKLQNLLARTLATEKRSFFVVNISESRAQMYEFTAASSELRLKWCKLINDKADELKKVSKLPLLNSDFGQTSQVDHVAMERNRLSRISRKFRGGAVAHTHERSSPTEEGLYEVTSPLRHLEISEDSRSEGELILPEEVSVSHAVTLQSTAISSSLELLWKENEEKIQAALRERRRLLAELFNLSWDQYLAVIAQQVCRHEPHQEVQDGYQGNGTSPEFLLGKAMDINAGFLKLISGARQQKQQKLDEVTCSFLFSDLSALSPDYTCQGEGAHAGTAQPDMSIPIEQVRNMAAEMNDVLATLKISISSGNEERHHLRQEIQKAQLDLDSLKQQRQAEESGSGRTSPYEPLSPQAIGSPLLTDIEQEEATASSALQLQEGDTSAPGRSSEVPALGIVHHGIQEATVTQLEESVESLSLSSDPTDLVPVVATETRTSGTASPAAPAASDGEEEDDDNNAVSVADLPLPELVSTEATDLMSTQLLQVIDVDHSLDIDMLTFRTNDQDFSSLTTTLEDIDGEEREVVTAGPPQ